MSEKGGRLMSEFQLLRYVPDAVRNEFVNIGVILRERGSHEPAEVRFTRDWRRLRCLDPDADTNLLEGMEGELRRYFRDERGGKLVQLLEQSLSLNVQISDPKGYLAESLPSGIEELMLLYVESPPRKRADQLRGRTAIQSKMRRELERAGVWDLLRKQIPASDYTRPGDSLRIDAGYRSDGRIRMFQAVSLEGGPEWAKVLAFSSAALRAGVERVEKSSLELTALIEPGPTVDANDDQSERLETYRFCVETMEEHQIRVLTTSDLSALAETARRELLEG